MNKYYLHDGSENIGPFEIEELKEHNLTRITQVWCEGMEDWKEAGSIDELKILLPVLPPPLKKANTETTTTNKVKTKKSIFFRIFKLLGITFLVIVLLLVVVNVIARQSPSPTYQESVMTIQEIEAANPLDYLSADGTYNENFIGDKIKINGFITNTATVTSYKDVTVRVNFYSKTHTLIGSENYTLYEFYPPNTKQAFKLRVKAYSNVSTIGWDVINASIK